MIVNTKSKPIQLRLRTMAITTAFAILIGLVYTLPVFKDEIMGINRQFWGISLVILFLLISLYHFYLNYNYIYLNIEKNKLVLRYYSLRIFGAAKKSIVIPLNEVADSKIITSFFGLKKNLIIYKKVKNRIAKYPPVSITALNKDELELVKSTFLKIRKIQNR